MNDPQPCPEWPHCDDDEGPCEACRQYAERLDQILAATELPDEQDEP